MNEIGRKAFGRSNTHRFPKEDNVRLDKPFTRFASTPRNALFFDAILHLCVAKWVFALDTTLGGEAAMCLDDLVRRDARQPLEGIDVLRET